MHVSVCLSVCLHSHGCISGSIFAKSGTEVTTLKSKNQYTKLRVSIIMNSATGQIPHSTECISSIIAIILKQNFTTTCTSLKEDTTVQSICRKNEIQQNAEILKCSYFLRLLCASAESKSKTVITYQAGPTGNTKPQQRQAC